MADVPFNVLLEQATVLKTAQLAVDRTAYDGHPTWLRNSLFSTLEVIESRQNPSFSVRLQASADFKSRGNDFVSSGNFSNAINEYHRALAVWEWIESKLKDWKQHAIKDEDLLHQKFTPTHESQAVAVQALKTSCLLNLAHCHLQLKQFSLAIEACDYVLADDPNCAKALYRRALARTLPFSSGTVDHQLALQDLKRARDCLPSDAAIQRAYLELKQSLAKQQATDKQTFGNLFQRPDYEAASLAPSPSPIPEAPPAAKSLTLGDLRGMQRDIDSRIEHLQREGEHAEDIALLRRKRAVLQDALTYCQSQASPAPHPEDYLHPTEEMLAHARAQGVDLTDPRVQQLLADLHRQEGSGDCPPSSSPSASSSSLPTAREDPVEQALQRLYAREASDLVQRILQDTTPTERKEMLQHRLRQETDVKDDRADASPDQVEQALRERLQTDYLALYRRYYQGRAAPPPASPTGDQDECEREEWVQQVLQVLQQYYAAPLESGGAAKAAPRSWGWSLAVWMFGFLVMQVMLFGYRYFMHPVEMQ